MYMEGLHKCTKYYAEAQLTKQNVSNCKTAILVGVKVLIRCGSY